MHSIELAKLKRNVCGIMASFMLIVFLCSIFVIATESDHDCCGNDCPVCACIRTCESVLRQIGSGTAAGVTTCITIALTGMIVLFYLNICRQETPVTQKVRLNN